MDSSPLIIHLQRVLGASILLALPVSCAGSFSRLINHCAGPLVGLSSSAALVYLGIEPFCKGPSQATTIRDHVTRVRESDYYIFQSPIQNLFKEALKGKYPEDKPILFGLRASPGAGTLNNVNYALFPPAPTPELGFFPAMAFHLGLKEANPDNLYAYLSKDDIAEYIKKNSFVIHHELGHLLLDHRQREDAFHKSITSGIVGTGLLCNLIAMTRTQASPYEKVGHITMMGSLVPLSYYAIKLLYLRFGRFVEQEADDFAIKQAKSREELVEGHRYMSYNFLPVEFKIGPKTFIERLDNIKNRLLLTHPPIQERLEKLQQSVDTWDSRNI